MVIIYVHSPVSIKEYVFLFQILLGIIYSAADSVLLLSSGALIICLTLRRT